MKFGKKKMVVATFLLATTLVVTGIRVQSSSASNDVKELKAQWTKIGNGNLRAAEKNDKWQLYSTPAVYLNMLGIKGKQRTLLSKQVYDISGLDAAIVTSKEQQIEELNLISEKGGPINVLKSNDRVYNMDVEISEELTNGKLIVGDNINYENIWLVEPKGNFESMLDINGLETLREKVKSYGDLGESAGQAIWASNPKVVNNDTVVFYSNRDSIKDQFFPLSLYSINETNKIPKLLLDAKKYGEEIQLIGSSKNTIIGFLSEKHLLLIHDLSNGLTKEVAFEGFPDSVSPDGKSLLFRKVINNNVQKEFSIFDLQNNTIKEIGMPEGYFYNMVGAWSKKGDKFAFYLNGDENNEPNKAYRTNVKIATINVDEGTISTYDKPSSSSNLYTLGNISWIGNDYVVAYTDDNNSWALNLKEVKQ